jgi:hypothetical protein
LRHVFFRLDASKYCTHIVQKSAGSRAAHNKCHVDYTAQSRPFDALASTARKTGRGREITARANSRIVPLTSRGKQGRRAYAATSLTVLYCVQSNRNPAGVDYKTARVCSPVAQQRHSGLRQAIPPPKEK